MITNNFCKQFKYYFNPRKIIIKNAFCKINSQEKKRKKTAYLYKLIWSVACQQ